MRRNIQTLKLVVEAMDEEKLRLAEEKRSKRADYVSPKVTEKSGGKAKREKYVRVISVSEWYKMLNIKFSCV